MQTLVLSPKMLRNFGFMMAGVIGGFFGIVFQLIRGRDLGWNVWIYIAIAFMVPALVYPRSLGPVYRLWMKVGMVLGAINSRIILGFLFFFMFTPLATVFRLIRRDVLKKNLDASLKTYRVERKPSDPVKHMERPY